MYLVTKLLTKSNQLLLRWHLDFDNFHSCPTFTSRTQGFQTTRRNLFKYSISKDFYHSSTQGGDHVQYQEKTPTELADEPKTKSPISSPFTAEYREEGQSRDILRSQPLKPWSEPLALPTVMEKRSDSRVEISSEQRRFQRRRAVAEKVRRHKSEKAHVNDLLKDRGITSYDWGIPLEILRKHTKAHDVELVQQLTIRKVRPAQKSEQCHLHVDQIDVPLNWTEDKLCNYIEQLAMSSVTPSAQRRLYAKGESRVVAVSRIIARTLKSARARESLCPRVFNMALSFLYGTNQIPEAMSLFVFMEWLRMDIPSETIGIMLHWTAKYKDLHNFTHLLRMFIRRGIMPIASWWTALVLVVQSKEARSAIVDHMRERGLLKSTSTAKQVARLVVGDEISQFFGIDFDLEYFLAHMDLQFGTEWMSASSGNAILREVCRWKPPSEAIDMLDTLKGRGMRVNVVTLNTLLQACSRERDHLLTINVLQLKENNHVEPDKKMYEILLMQAWRSRLYNFARVIWRSACTDGLVTSKLRALVKANLMYNNSHISFDESQGRAYVWSRSAGKVIVGICPPHNYISSYSRESKLKAKTKRRSRIIARNSRLMKEKFILSDLDAVGQYRLVDSLSHLLAKALELDRNWMRKGVLKQKSSRLKRKWAIKVPVRRIESQQEPQQEPSATIRRICSDSPPLSTRLTTNDEGETGSNSDVGPAKCQLSRMIIRRV